MEHAKRRIRMQVRATPEDGEGTFTAKVSTYNLEYDVGWAWTEIILPGCFTDSISAHPTIPIFYNHNWSGAPIGSGKPSEDGDNLTVSGRLYLEMGDPLVARVYQAMKDEALEEWSIGFWPEVIVNDQDKKMCDQIQKGDLAEASVCVRGANPDTGTIDLAGRVAYIAGDQKARDREVARLRSLFGGPGRRRAGGAYEPEPYRQDGDELVVCPKCTKRNDSDAGWCDQCGYNLHLVGWRPAPYHQDVDEVVTCPTCGLRDDVDASFCDQCGFELAGAEDVDVDDDVDEEAAGRRRAAGHSHQHTHDDGTVHAHDHTHSGGNYGHDASDPEVTHAHSHPDPEPPPSSEDPGPDENDRARADRAFDSPHWRDYAAGILKERRP
jgi:HK97 family phage prohead protease